MLIATHLVALNIVDDVRHVVVIILFLLGLRHLVLLAPPRDELSAPGAGLLLRPAATRALRSPRRSSDVDLVKVASYDMKASKSAGQA